MIYYEFEANQLFCEIDDNKLIICSLSKGVFSNPDDYLILQRFNKSEDLYKYEVCNLENSGEGGFEIVEVFDNLLVISFNNILQNKYNLLGLKIYTKSCDLSTLNKCLKLLFLNSDCKLIFN